MAYSNPYNVYRETSVKTASPGKLIIMLYEGAIKQLTMASEYINDDGKILPNNIEALSKCITKAQEIITELMVSLDMDKGGDIAKNLMSLYVYFNDELLRANISKEKSKILEVKKMMSDLLSAWNVVVETEVPTANTPIRNNLDING